MKNATNVELDCARPIPHKEAVLQFLKRALTTVKPATIIPDRNLIPDREAILDAIRDKPLYVRVENPAWLQRPEANFMKSAKKFFNREVVAIMKIGKSSYTVVLL